MAFLERFGRRSIVLKVYKRAGRASLVLSKLEEELALDEEEQESSSFLYQVQNVEEEKEHEYETDEEEEDESKDENVEKSNNDHKVITEEKQMEEVDVNNHDSQIIERMENFNITDKEALLKDSSTKEESIIKENDKHEKKTEFDETITGKEEELTMEEIEVHPEKEITQDDTIGHIIDPREQSKENNQDIQSSENEVKEQNASDKRPRPKGTGWQITKQGSLHRVRVPIALASHKTEGLVDHPNRDNVRAEVLDSEKRYLEDLKLTQEVFLKGLRGASKKPHSLVNPEIIDIIFCNLEEIISFSENLMNAVSQKTKSDEVMPFFKEFLRLKQELLSVYIPYVTNYLKSDMEIKNLKILNGDFVSWLQSVEKNPKLNKRHLEDFLIMPVQRPPRYLMLAKEMLKETGKINEEYEELKRVVSELESICGKINEAQSESIGKFAKENARRVAIEEAILIKPKNKKSYIKYIITVFKNDVPQFHVGRRYAQFHHLHKKLKNDYPEQQLPYMPKKKIIKGSTTTEVVEKRSRKLSRFLNELLSSPIFCYNRHLNDFLHPFSVVY